MAEKKQDQDVDAMLDRLLKGWSPEEVVGSGGLLEDLTKRLLERALEGELTDHLGYEKHAEEGRNRGNSRNGRTRKRVKTDTAEMEIEVPRDRDGSFEPKLVPVLSQHYYAVLIRNCMRSRHALLFAFATLAVACSSPSAEQSGLVNLPGEPVDTLRIPVLFSTAEYPFGEVSSAEPLTDGGLAVSDYLNSNVVLFDSSGTMVGEIGRPGDGPGETSGPGLVTQFVDGSLAVLSHSASRVTVFDGDEIETFPFTVRTNGRYFSGRIAPGPVLYAQHLESDVTPSEFRFIKADPSRKRVNYDRHVSFPLLPIVEYEFRDGTVLPHVYSSDIRHKTINRNGDFAYIDRDTTIVVGNVETGISDRFAYPDWTPIEQDLDMVEELYGDFGRPPGFSEVDPLMTTGLYLDDSNRLWFGRTNRYVADRGAEYSAIVVDLATMESVAVTLPARSRFYPEMFYVRGDHAAAVIEDDSDVNRVLLLDLSGLPWSARSN